MSRGSAVTRKKTLGEGVKAKRMVLASVFHLLLVTAGLGAPMTQIRYEVEDIGPRRWQYTYEVVNVAMPARVWRSSPYILVRVSVRIYPC